MSEKAPKATEKLNFKVTPDQADWLRERGITETIMTALEAQHADFPTEKRAVGMRDEPGRNRPTGENRHE